MGLNYDLPSLLGVLLPDHRVAVAHALLLGDAAASARGWQLPRCRARGPVAVWLPVARQSGAAGSTWESGPRGMRRSWRSCSTGMMQGAWGVHGMSRGTSPPSSGARGGRPLFAAFARFAAAEAARVALFRMMPLSQTSLPLCGKCSQNLTYASRVRSDHENHTS